MYQVQMPKLATAFRNVGTQMKLPALQRIANKLMNNPTYFKAQKALGDQRRVRQRREAPIRPNPVN